MRRQYPYLQDSYYENENNKKERLEFLKTIDDFVNQKQYVRITLLNWQEAPLKEIQGELTSGSITKDGASSVRRTCSLSATVNGEEYDVDDMKMDFSINKKIFIEVGVKNYSKRYEEYPILWFPQGVFFISTFSINSSASSTVNISLSLKDKMCGLNGEVGGTFPSTVILDTVDTQTSSGEYVSEKVPIYNLIQELVNHFGGENLNNIIIEDVPLRIKRVMKWSGDNPIYLVPKNDAAAGYDRYDVSQTESAEPGTLLITNGTDAGYVYDDFYYTDELTANLGETVTSVLDKLKQYLGNYEYFYDEFGVFHFREIKNYLNTTQGTVLLNDMDKNDYLVETTVGKSSFIFSGDTNLISLTVNPQYGNIKNDYIIQGVRKMTGTDISYDVRYHLAIDKKPKTNNEYFDLLLYKDPTVGDTTAAFPYKVDTWDDLPMPGNFNVVYRVVDEGKNYYWDNDSYKMLEEVKYYDTPKEGVDSNGYVAKDWRTEIYLRGLLANNNGTDAGMYYYKLDNDMEYNDVNSKDLWVRDVYDYIQNDRVDTDYYYEELAAFWPQMYNLETQKFYDEEQVESMRDDGKPFTTGMLTNGNFYLDIIDSDDSDLGEFAVQNIGRRTDAVKNDDVNCLFQPDIPNIVFINNAVDNVDDLKRECDNEGQPWTLVSQDVFNGFFTGGYKNGAFDQIKYELYLHTNYQKTVSIVALPAFYLEPNTRCTIDDKSTNTHGDFVISNLTLPFGPGNTMSISASECFERF